MIPILKIKDNDGNVREIPALKGSVGKSAYEIAVDGGFEGTEEEWLDELKGTSDYLKLENRPNIIPIEKCDIVGEAMALSYNTSGKLRHIKINLDKITDEYQNYTFYLSNLLIHYSYPLMTFFYEKQLIGIYFLQHDIIATPSDLLYMYKIEDNIWQIRCGLRGCLVTKNDDGTFSKDLTNVASQSYVTSQLSSYRTSAEQDTIDTEIKESIPTVSNDFTDSDKETLDSLAKKESTWDAKQDALTDSDKQAIADMHNDPVVEQVLTDGVEIAKIGDTSLFAPSGGNDEWELIQDATLTEEVAYFVNDIPDDIHEFQIYLWCLPNEAAANGNYMRVGFNWKTIDTNNTVCQTNESLPTSGYRWFNFHGRRTGKQWTAEYRMSTNTYGGTWSGGYSSYGMKSGNFFEIDDIENIGIGTRQNFGVGTIFRLYIR